MVSTNGSFRYNKVRSKPSPKLVKRFPAEFWPSVIRRGLMVVQTLRLIVISYIPLLSSLNSNRRVTQ